MLGSDDLVLCAGTLLRVPLVERIAAAAAAGFTALSLWPEDYQRARATGLTDADLRAMLADHGLAIAELDCLGRWLPAGPSDPPLFGHDAEVLLPIADAVGARSLNALELYGRRVPVEVAAEAFAGLCDRAAEHGLLVHLEFLPWSGIPDITAAWEIVRLAGRANGGLMLDAWHHIRSRQGLDAVAAVPADRILGLQLADAPAAPDGHILDETMRRRRLPGEGDGDLAALVQLLDRGGCTAPVGVEVFSDALAALPAAEAARRAHDTARAVVASVRH
jgi:sugar phosphate isomerase/epimerase